MSTGMFEGLGGILEPQSEPSYTPGQVPEYDALIAEMLDDFSTIDTCDRFMRYPSRFRRKFRKPLLREMGEKGRLSGQLFLDALVQEFCTRADGVSQFFAAPLLGPALTALYEAGSNGLSLDVTCLSHYSTQVGGFVNGRKGKPLMLDCLLHEAQYSLAEAGGFSSYAEFRIRGAVRWVGQHSAHSEFSLENLLEDSVELGKGSTACVFRLPEMSDIRLVSGTMDGPYACMSKCVGIVAGTGKEAHVEFDRDFFRKGNRLLIADGRSWRELTRDDAVVDLGYHSLSSSRYGGLTR